MTRVPYAAVALRYVHDIATGEFANLGLLVLCPKQGVFKFAGAKRFKRALDFFPGARAMTLRAAIRCARASADKVLGQAAKGAANGEEADLYELAERVAREIVPKDDSGLQWSEVSVGLTADASSTFERLFERLVVRYDGSSTKTTRSDDQVWSTFSKSLERRQVSAYIREHQVVGRLETVTFKHALKNGKWHLMEPVSFDLSNAESVTDKAKRLLGEMMLLRERSNEFKLYFLVGQPRHEDVLDAYDKALRILEEVPCETAIYREDQAEQFATELSRIAATH